ncbi:MAG: DNA photolyase family protein [Chloroflexi bacterium]|nr:DNA photolyase family protein [Chloroflexota bacterium]
MSANLVLFRRDLRLADNPALSRAGERGGPIIPVFIWEPAEEHPWEPGAASRWWLHHSLTALTRRLKAYGSTLIIRRGPSLVTVQDLLGETGADAVFWNRRYEPAAGAHDAELESMLTSRGVHAESTNGTLLIEPWTVKTQTGQPYQVFTQFWKNILSREPPDPPQPGHTALPRPQQWPSSLPLSSLPLLPETDWAAGLRATWTPGEEGARAHLDRFLNESLTRYSDLKDQVAQSGSSLLSPHLHWGEISVRQIWHAVLATQPGLRSDNRDAQGSAFLRELLWREFAYHILFHFPHTSDSPLRRQYLQFPWQNDQHSLRAWQRGQTGYPIVDAGMRQLWQTGWMHNRCRLIVASFLTKDLLIDWREGARWFWDTLVDADLANNSLNWQWAAGCGADASPYFRIFNPVLQAKKFDFEGSYIRRWVPELARLPSAWIHQPWIAPPDVLQRAGVSIGSTYPAPIVSHSEARARALAALASI